MKSLRPFLLSLLAVALTGSLPAQSETQPAGKSVELARVAYVNSTAFLNETTGIKQLVRATNTLENEFVDTQSELSLLNEKLRTISGEINKLRADPVANAKALEDQQTEGLRIQQELQTKQQAAQTRFDQRQQELQGPVAGEITKELQAFAKERNIGMLFDSAKLGAALLDAKPELDVTADFISAFNAKHP